MKNIFIAIICIGFLAGCAPTAQQIQKATEQTQTAMPAPTAFSEDYIESQLFSSVFYKVDELGLKPGSIENSSTHGYSVKDITDYSKAFGMDLQDAQGKSGGEISLFLFQDQASSDKGLLAAKGDVSSGVDPSGIDDIGNLSSAWLDGEDGGSLFQVCKAVISIQTRTVGAQVVVDYSNRLFSRMKPLLCK